MHTKRKGPVSTSKLPRLGGGPRLPKKIFDWWTRESYRVAQVEGLLHCSLATLLARIAQANLDLTQTGIARYQTLKRETSAAAD